MIEALPMPAVVTAGLVLLAFATPESSMAYMYASVFVFGAGESAAIVCFSSCIGKFLGVKNFAQIFGVIFVAKAAGDAVGSPLVAAIADSAIGWSGSLIVCAVCAILSAVLFMFAKKEKKLVELEEQTLNELEGK